ncbi:MAG: hypothetical protein Kow0022_16510 [Phycisphaerales bacterium]
MRGGQNEKPGERIVSSFADDPEMKELIEYFVSELPQRTKALEQAWQAADFGSLSRLAHQLKGAAGGFGFAQIGEVAGEIESSIGHAPVGEDTVRALETQVRRLLDLCARAAADSTTRS